MQNHINTLLSNISISYRTNTEMLMCDIGLHAGQAQILLALWGNDGLSQAEIVRELSISAPTVNSLVSKLEKSKFIKCKKCPKDKRLVRIFLTKKGADVRKEAYQQWQKLEEQIFVDFSDTEKIMAYMLLEKIKNNLQTDLAQSKHL
jgi:DNA-binding MarR family transcriptional regulator